MALYFNSDKLVGDPDRNLVTERKDIAVARSMPVSTIDPNFKSAGINSFGNLDGINIKQNTKMFSSSDTAYYLLTVGDYFVYNGRTSGGDSSVGIAHVCKQGGLGYLVILGTAWTESTLNGSNGWRLFAVPGAVSSANSAPAEMQTIATEVNMEA